MKLLFTTILTFLLTVTFSQNEWKQIGSISGNKNFENSGSSVSIDGSGDIVAIGEPSANTSTFDAGRVRVFKLHDSKWQQIGKDIVGSRDSDFLGRKVKLSFDGKTLATGGFANNKELNGRGFVKVFTWNGRSWVQKGKDIIGKEDNENFGQSLSLNGTGDVLIVGGTHNSKNGTKTGVVRVYKWFKTKWIQVGEDFYGIGVDDYYGYSVDLNYTGDILAIGALSYGDSISYGGRVELYQWNNNSWTNLGSKIRGSQQGEMAAAISLDSTGNRLVIGAAGNNLSGNFSGQVRVYNYANKDWKLLGDPLNGKVNYRLGSSVALNSDGTILAAGAHSNSDNGEESGSVVTYQLVNSKWVQLYNPILGQNSFDWFGSSIDINAIGDVLIIGAYGNDSKGQESGQTRILKR